jgi:hypothetical protein
MKAFARPKGFAGVISATAAKVASTREDEFTGFSHGREPVQCNV